VNDDVDVIDGGALRGAVRLGDDEGAVTITVRPLTVAQIPGFTRAIRPMLDVVADVMANGVNFDTLAGAVEGNFTDMVAALAAATTRFPRGASDDDKASALAARAEQIEAATVEQVLELLLAVIQANKDFLRGRLVLALRTAAMLKAGAGLMSLSPSSAPDSPVTT
jgi:hypothetical protein